MDEKLHTSDQVYVYIKEKIHSQEWEVGMKIDSENKMATDLGISRVSVREAIEKLVALNVLRKKQGEGTFVNELSPSLYLNGLIPMILMDKDNLIDVLEFRKMVEVDSARLCAERCDDDDIKLMEESYGNMVKYQNDSENFYKADYNFHMAIAKGTKNSLIIKVNSIMTDLLMYHQKEIYQHLGPRGGLNEHAVILNAIKDRDVELAVLYMRRHIERTIKDIQNMKK
ncbi:MAG: FadR family transcriptional regulator [Clostridiales bacterium]|nr:FadR family transcriptional regulator [Clostridiales bacterium]